MFTVYTEFQDIYPRKRLEIDDFFFVVGIVVLILTFRLYLKGVSATVLQSSCVLMSFLKIKYLHNNLDKTLMVPSYTCLRHADFH